MPQHVNRLLLVGATLAALNGTALAEDKIKLKVATFLAANHFQVVNGSQVWMDEVKRLTNGRVEFEYYPAEQLGKAAKLMELMKAGVIDIAEVAPAYVTDKLPLVGVIEMPGLTDSSCAGAKALRQLSEPGGLIYNADFKTNQVRPLTFFIYPPYKLQMATRPINHVEDFKGLKMRVSGGAMGLVADRLGSVAVRMASPEIYESLSRGTIDGLFFSLISVKQDSLQTIAKNTTLGYSFGTPSVVMSMSDQKFASLPKDVQEAFIKAGPVADQNYCRYVDGMEQQLEGEFVKEGIKVSHFSDEEKKKLDTLLAPIGTEWAAGLDARGKPGTKVLQAYREAVSEK